LNELQTTWIYICHVQVKWNPTGCEKKGGTPQLHLAECAASSITWRD